jgi:hypothetical protein
MLVRADQAVDRSFKRVMPAAHRSSLTTTADHNETGQRPTKADTGKAESQASDGNRQRTRTLQADALMDGQATVKTGLTLTRRSAPSAYAELAGPATGQKRRSSRGKPRQPETTHDSPTSMLVCAAQASDGHDRSSRLVMRVRFPSSALLVPWLVNGAFRLKPWGPARAHAGPHARGGQIRRSSAKR